MKSIWLKWDGVLNVPTIIIALSYFVIIEYQTPSKSFNCFIFLKTFMDSFLQFGKTFIYRNNIGALIQSNSVQQTLFYRP